MCCRDAVYSDRRKAVHGLYVSLRLQHDDSDYFERLVSLRKGIKLVARLLPLLKHVSRFATVAFCRSTLLDGLCTCSVLSYMFVHVVGSFDTVIFFSVFDDRTKLWW